MTITKPVDRKLEQFCSACYIINQGALIGAFASKTVLILGGSRGIGTVIVRRFITDGASVRFTCTRSKDAAKRLAQKIGATAVFTGSTDRDTVIDVIRRSGALDILVIDVGIGVFGEALELNADNIDRLFRINIHAPYHTSVEAARQMSEGGRVLIIDSVNGDRIPVTGIAAYATNKSTLRGMTCRLARDFGPCGITINAVQPGPVDTGANPVNGPMRDMLHGLMAIKRHGQSEEVASMIAWLAGPEASSVTGAMHTTDGALGV